MSAVSTAVFKHPLAGRIALAVIGLAGGAMLTASLAARVEAFWRLSRMPKLIVLAGGSLLLGLIVALALGAAWRKIQAPAADRPGGARLLGGRSLWAAAALALGLGLRFALPAAAVPLLHVLEIETTPSTAGTHAPVTLVELRGADGRIIPFSDLQLEGWQRIPQGLQAGGPARLRYGFYAAPGGQVEAIFADGPAAGAVLARLDGTEHRIDLASASQGQRLAPLPFRQRSRLETPLRLVDTAVFGLVAPVFLFLAPFALYAGWKRTRELAAQTRLAFPRLHADKTFITAWLLLSMLPLAGFRGDLAELETNFFGRQKILDGYVFLRYNILRDRLFDQTLVGQDGWLVLANPQSMDDYQHVNLFKDEELFGIQQRIDRLTDTFAARGITFLVVVLPNKNTIYPEAVPPSIPVIGPVSRLDQLLAYQAEHGRAGIVDARPALLRARQQHEVFYRTDSHWNDYGAHAGYLAVMAALQARYPEMRAHPLEDFSYTEWAIQLGDLGANWLPSSAPEPFFHLEPRFPRTIRRYELLDERHLYSFRDNPALPEDAPTAVIYHDSFMPWMAPFLTDHFRRSLFIWDPVLQLSLIESERPDVVIYETTERVLDSLLQLPLVAPAAP